MRASDNRAHERVSPVDRAIPTIRVDHRTDNASLDELHPAASVAVPDVRCAAF